MTKKVTVSGQEEGAKLVIPTTRDQVPQAIEALKKQLAKLKGGEEESLSLDITSKSGGGTNIKNVTTVTEILEISASIHAREKAFNQEIKRFKLSDMNIKPFEEDGKSVKHWDKVLAKAINTIINAGKIKVLEDSIAGLSKHLDEETKLQNELSEIMNNASQYIE
jgi:hypothetical protein